MVDDAFLTAKEIAKILKISNALAYKLISTGHIQGCRFGRTVRVPVRSFEQFLAGNLTIKNIDHAKSN